MIKHLFVEAFRLPRIWMSLLLQKQNWVVCVCAYFCEKEGENESVCSTWAQNLETKDVFQWETAHWHLSLWPYWEDAGLWTGGYITVLLRVSVFMQKTLAKIQIIK